MTIKELIKVCKNAECTELTRYRCVFTKGYLEIILTIDSFNIAQLSVYSKVSPTRLELLRTYTTTPCTWDRWRLNRFWNKMQEKRLQGMDAKVQELINKSSRHHNTDSISLLESKEPPKGGK